MTTAAEAMSKVTRKMYNIAIKCIKKYCQTEYHRHGISLTHASILCRALGITFDELVEGADET